MLRECIASVQAQRLEPYEGKIHWEHVVYDDGSTDDTAGYFSQPIPHVRYVRSSVNEGIPIASNRAVRSCASEYIFELDSDDMMPQRALVNFTRTLEQDPRVEWIIADYYRMDERGSYVVGGDYYGWDFGDRGAILEAIFAGNFYIQRNVLYKRALFERVGGYDEDMSMAEDLDLFVRFLLVGSMPRFVQYVSHMHRVHESNYSRDVDHAHHMRDVASIYSKYASQLKELGIRCEGM